MVVSQIYWEDSKLLNALYPTVRRLERFREIPRIIGDGGRVEESNKEWRKAHAKQATGRPVWVARAPKLERTYSGVVLIRRYKLGPHMHYSIINL
jgi:hypothetical protein